MPFFFCLFLTSLPLPLIKDSSIEKTVLPLENHNTGIFRNTPSCGVVRQAGPGRERLTTVKKFTTVHYMI